MSMSQLIPEIWTNQIVAQLTKTPTLFGAFPEVTDEARARYAAKRAARAEYLTALRTALDISDDPTVRAVADLHGTDGYGYCTGCDFAGYDSEPTDWPCRTSELLGATLGLEVVDG